MVTQVRSYITEPVFSACIQMNNADKHLLKLNNPEKKNHVLVQALPIKYKNVNTASVISSINA